MTTTVISRKPDETKEAFAERWCAALYDVEHPGDGPNLNFFSVTEEVAEDGSGRTVTFVFRETLDKPKEPA